MIAPNVIKSKNDQVLVSIEDGGRYWCVRHGAHGGRKTVRGEVQNAGEFRKRTAYSGNLVLDKAFLKVPDHAAEVGIRENRYDNNHEWQSDDPESGNSGACEYPSHTEERGPGGTLRSHGGPDNVLDAHYITMSVIDRPHVLEIHTLQREDKESF